MALYTLMSDDEWSKISNSFNPNQTRIYNTLRGDGSKNSGNGSDDNFFVKRAKSLENAFGTTGAALYETGGDLLGAAIAGLTGGDYTSARSKEHNEGTQKLLNEGFTTRDNILKDSGYNDISDYYDALEQAENKAFGNSGFDIEGYRNKMADITMNDPRGKSKEYSDLRQTYTDAVSKLSGDDAETMSKLLDIKDKLDNNNKSVSTAIDKRAADYNDYRTNNYVGQKLNQDRGKFLGSSINTLSTMFDVLAPGAGSSIAANAIQGGLEGVADELEQNGLENFDWGRAGQNALIGATTGAVTGGLNKGLNKIASTTGNILPGSNIASKVGNAGINATRAALNYAPIKSNGLVGQLANNVTQGALRGAISGEVGGATGAGLSAAMNGGDIIGSAIEGAKRGVQQGALAGGVMAGANTAVNVAKNAINGVPTNGIQDTEVTNKMPKQSQVTEEDMGLAPAFEPEDIIQNRNKLQSLGSQLEKAADRQKYASLYGNLNGATADRAIKTGAVEKLESLGVRPENYLEAAKTSSYVNDVVDKIAKNSEVTAVVPDLMDRLSSDNMGIFLPTEKAQKTYDKYIRNIVPDGPRLGRANSTPDEYSAAYLVDESRKLGKVANRIGKSNAEGAKELAAALSEAKHILRDTAGEALSGEEITGNMTNDQIRQGLAKLGANEKIQDYYTESVDGKAPTVGDYIKRSAYFEQARDMGNQMEAGRYSKSGANSSPNAMTQLWNASGLAEPTKVVLNNTVAPAASGITRTAGKIIGGVGNAAARVKDVLGGGETPTPTATIVPTNAVETAYNPATKVYEAIGRTEGLTNAEQARTADYLVDAVQNTNTTPNVPNAGTLESVVSPTTATNTSVYNSVYGNGYGTANLNNTTNAQTQSQNGKSYVPTTGDYWTDLLGRAMSAAIDANDVSAFTSLYSMYQDSLANLQKQQQSSNKQTKLTSTQQRANAAMDSLDRLSNMTPDLGYNLSGIPVIGNIATLGGNDYEGEAKSLAQQIGYMVSGANIKEEEAYNIGKAYVPQPFDSEQTRKLKLQRAYNIIRQYQNGTAEE